MGIYKKYRLKCKSIQDIFSNFFLFIIYKMVDIIKFLNINIGTVMKNPVMLEFVPEHLNTKKCVRTQLKNYLIY